MSSTYTKADLEAMRKYHIQEGDHCKECCEPWPCVVAV